MDKIYIFDIDGTLTPSRQKMTEEFLEFFNGWSKKNNFYLVTGSDLLKMKEQVPDFILNRANGLFTCCGNQFYIDNNLIYNNKFKPSDELLKYLEDTLDDSDYPIKAGVHIEDRGSMVNFSMVGRKCTLQERKDYFEYDKLTGERYEIANYIKKNWKDLDAVIGGEISIDIYPKGNDKSQVLDIIKQTEITKTNEYIFIGDRIEGGGNDYPLAALMDNIVNCDWYHTSGWKETQKILENLID